MKLPLKIIFSLSLIISTIAMDKPDQSVNTNAAKNLKEWTEIFKTKVGEIMHTPQGVMTGGIFSGKGLTIDSNSYNGVALQSPLVLKVNCSREEFIEAMKKSGIVD